MHYVWNVCVITTEKNLNTILCLKKPPKKQELFTPHLIIIDI